VSSFVTSILIFLSSRGGHFTCTEGTCYIDLEAREDGAHSADSLVKTGGDIEGVIHNTAKSAHDETWMKWECIRVEIIPAPIN
jgi:hypothetical protein